MKGASVSLIPVTPSGAANSAAPSPELLRQRQATADPQGAFEFTQLPAGTYRVVASAGPFAAQYLSGAYGAKRPGDTGLPVALATGQVLEKAIIALLRGGVLAGRVTDEAGQPLTRVQVYPLWFPPGSSRGVRNSPGTQSDDLGQFRLFGLQPGEYVVVAEARPNTFVSPNTIVNPEEESTGFITTYYPGVADVASAQQLRAAAGREMGGIEIRLLQGRLYRVSGSVVDSLGKPAARVNGNLMQMQTEAGTPMMFGASFMTDEQGQFQTRNVAPGNYRLIIRPRTEMVNGQPSVSGERANAALVVTADIEGLVITTSPGATITGRIVFDVPPSSPPKQLRVYANSGDVDMIGMNQAPATVQPDMTFTMKGLMGEYVLRASAPDVYMKSVTVGAADVTDTPREFKNGDRVTIVLSSRASTVEGTVSDGSGQPATNAAVMLFPDEKSAWRFTSIRVRRTSVDGTGQFRIRGVLAGRYYLVALPRDRLLIPGPLSTSFFEELVKDATEVLVGEDEQRTVDLKVIESRGGG